MQFTDEKLQSLLEEADERERRARKRAMIYSFLPIVLAGLLLIFTGWRIQTAEHQVAILNEQAERYRKEAASLQSKLDDLNSALEKVSNELRQATEFRQHAF